MDPKTLAEFIAQHGRVVAQDRIDPPSTDPFADPKWKYTFEDGATFTLTPSVVDPKTGQEISPQKIEADESKPVAEARKPATVTSATATNTSTSYEWRDVGNGQRRLHVITKDQSGKVIADDEATPAQQREYEQSEQRSRNPGGKTDAEVQTETDTKRNKWTEIKRETKKNEQTGVSEVVITEQNDLGETRERKATEQVTQKPDKPTLVDLPGGGKGQLVPDPDNPGQWKAVPIEGTAGPAPGQGPSLSDLELRYGNIVGGLKDYAAKLQEALAAGTITKADFDKRWEEAKAVANTQVNEINSLVSTQRGYYSEQSANWRQEQATANTRLNAAGDALQLGMQAANSLKGLDPSGSAGTGQLWGAITAGRAAGEMYGGYASGPPPALPPAAATIMDMGFTEDGRIVINPRGSQGAATAGAGGPPGATGAMPASVGAIDQGLKQAMDADIASAGGGGSLLGAPSGTPVGGGMSFTGGQLRAPGVGGDMPISAIVGGSYDELKNDFGFDDDIIAEAARSLMGGLA